MRVWSWPPDDCLVLVGVVQIIILYYLNLLPFCTLPEDILGVPIDEVRQHTLAAATTVKTLVSYTPSM